MTQKKFFIIWTIVTFLLFAGAVASLFMTTSAFDFVDADESQPVITSLGVQKNGDIRLDWSCENVDVTSYRIYRRANSSAPTVNVKANNFKYYVDEEAENGIVYTYYVVAYDSKTEKSSDESKSVSICKDTAQNVESLEQIVPELSVVTDGAGKLKLRWVPVKNVPFTSVCLYKKNSSGDWEVQKVYAPYITECDAEEGMEYKIVVRYTESDDFMTRSQDSEIVKAVA